MRGALLPIFLSLLTLRAATPASRLDSSNLEKVHAQRIQWMKQRAAVPPPGIYQDFRAVFTNSNAARAELARAARDSGAHIVITPGNSETRSGVLFVPPPAAGLQIVYQRAPAAEDPRLRSRLKEYPDEAFGAATDFQPAKPNKATAIAYSDAPAGVPPAVALRSTSTHILARELSEQEIRSSLEQGRAYVAHDWLCDPTGFFFVADNLLGGFEMGDTVAAGLTSGETHLSAYLPVPARIKLFRDGQVVADAVDSKISYTVKEPGAYRLEAWLTAGGEERPWIFSNPIYVLGTADVRLPPAEISAAVEMRSDISYTSEEPADEAKHKLDLYLPKDRKDFPLLLFVHGGAWRSGDRSLYRALGNRFARAGVGVAIPSYRLMPAHPFPAQMEDVAAAFAWVYKNAARLGGDARRIYVSGHSAGGHLAALLALNPAYLDRLGIEAGAIHGVIAMSGVYDVRNLRAFPFDGDKRQASPLEYAPAARNAPPFLITYCQWDYLGLPKQARDFAAALKKSFGSAQLVYIPGETHVSEIISAVKDDSPLTRAILSFVR